MRLLFGNMWLFKPLLLRVMPMISPQAGAMLQTTIAFTRLSGSDAYNVLPQEATLGANMRFIPHEGMEASLKKVKRLAKKHDLEMEVFHAVDASRSVDIRARASAWSAGPSRKPSPGWKPAPMS